MKRTIHAQGKGLCRGRCDRARGAHDDSAGAWRLAWLEEEGADRKIHRADCTGLLVYTRDGHMSVQIMYRNPIITHLAFYSGWPNTMSAITVAKEVFSKAGSHRAKRQ